METKTKSSEWKRGYQAAQNQIELRQDFLVRTFGLRGAANKIYDAYLNLLKVADEIKDAGYRVSDYTRGQIECYEELFAAR